ncbi:MAG: hypothetical protein IJ496_08555 [Ruminococcus sp.]|nr:hypothetical protein [Ruminococcus sp.]
MSYKIAIASSDGKQIDETFGSAKSFIIYEVTDGVYRQAEERIFHPDKIRDETAALLNRCGSSGGCGDRAHGGCGSSAGGGCSGQGDLSSKVMLISDCRCVVCKKIGFHIQKQLERKAISAFDVSCSAEEALDKITFYYSRIDKHESLRG